MNKKFGFIVLSFLVVIPSWNYIRKKLQNFYLFKVENTNTTKAFLVSSELYDATDMTNYNCQYRYQVGNTTYSVKESISIHDTATKFIAGDSIFVKYNVKRPWRGTIDSQYNLSFGLFFSICMCIWIIWAIVLLLINIMKFVKNIPQ